MDNPDLAVNQNIHQPVKEQSELTETGHAAPIIGLVLIVLFTVTVLLHRAQILSYPTTMAFIALILVLMLAIFICSAIAIINRSPCSYSKNARKTLVITGFVPLLILLYMLYIALFLRAPIIHDISTNLTDIPQFDKTIALRGSKSNSLAIKREVIELQQKSYPHIKTLFTPLNRQHAFEQALLVANTIGWTVHNIDPQQGIIEAWEKTYAWGFIDDVIVRVSATDTGSAIDLRSVSRLRKSDLGSNANRIVRFYAAFEAAQANN